MTDADEIVAKALDEVAEAIRRADDGVCLHLALIEHAKAVRERSSPAAPLPAGPGLELYRRVERRTPTADGSAYYVDTVARIPEAEAVIEAARKWAQIKADFDEFDGDRRSIAEHLHEAKEELAAAVSALDARLAKQGGAKGG